MEFLPRILLLFILIFLNGFFVASEFALVSVRKTRIDELVKRGNKAALLVQKALNNLGSFISATQLGITLASLALGWIGEPAIASFLDIYFVKFLPKEIALVSSHTIAVIIAFIGITFLHIVLGELAPKSIALAKTEVISMIIITPLTIFSKIFSPFIWILNVAGGLVLKLFGVKVNSLHKKSAHSEEEIKMILSQSAESGAIESQEVEMIYQVFRIGDMPVENIMIPQHNIIGFEMHMTVKEMIPLIKKKIHTRFLVYKDTKNHIIGFIHIKDLYSLALDQHQHKKISQTKLIREIIQVPFSRRIDDVLLDMQKFKAHVAVIIDQYGKTIGMVSLEDIIESLVGKIEQHPNTQPKRQTNF